MNQASGEIKIGNTGLNICQALKLFIENYTVAGVKINFLNNLLVVLVNIKCLLARENFNLPQNNKKKYNKF